MLAGCEKELRENHVDSDQVWCNPREFPPQAGLGLDPGPLPRPAARCPPRRPCPSDRESRQSPPVVVDGGVPTRVDSGQASSVVGGPQQSEEAFKRLTGCVYQLGSRASSVVKQLEGGHGPAVLIEKALGNEARHAFELRLGLVVQPGVLIGARVDSARPLAWVLSQQQLVKHVTADQSSVNDVWGVRVTCFQNPSRRENR